jgi:hypothetical protein
MVAVVPCRIGMVGAIATRTRTMPIARDSSISVICPAGTPA